MKKSYIFYFCIVIILIGLLKLALNDLFFSDKAREYNVVFVPKEGDEGTMFFWQVVESGAMMAAEEYDVNFKTVAPKSEADVEGQIKILEDLVEENPDVILLAAIDSKALIPVSRKIVESGITLIIIDSGLDEDIADCSISTDNVGGGYQIGEFIGKEANKNDEILVVSHKMASESATSRIRGITEGLKKYGMNDNIKEIFDCDVSSEMAYEYVKSILSQDNSIDYIVGTNEYSTVGIGRAVEELRMKDKVKVIGFDNTFDEIKYLESGVIKALVVQQNFAMGYTGVTTAISFITAEEGVMLEKEVKTSPVLVTKESMYSEDNQKLLFPFISE